MEATEYRISLVESRRRKIAFCSFVVAILAGLIISSIDLVIAHIVPALICASIIAGLMTLALIWNTRWQNNFARKRFLLSDEAIRQIDRRSEETFYYRDIKGITVKRTVKGYIRQIYLSLRSGKSSWISGLSPDDTERLYRTLADICPDADLKERKESIDFDHPVFYPILGLGLSSLFTFLVRLAAGLNETTITIVQTGIVVYIVIIGIIIFIMRPYYNLHGAKGRKTDRIMGLVFFVIAGILSFFLFG